MPSLLAVVVALALTGAGCGERIAETPMGDEALFEDRSLEIKQTVLAERGGRVDWSAALDRIAFDRKGDDGYFDVWTMRPDGTDQRCFTCELPGLPRKNVGQPAWHPSGEWLVVQAQRADHDVRQLFADPGRGVGNELWAVRWPGGEASRLTDVPDGPGHGVLHPHFSSDGATLTWGELTEGAGLLDGGGLIGVWALRSATFSAGSAGSDGSDGARLDVGLALAPGDRPGFVENHGLAPDGQRWIFSGNLDPAKRLAEINDIYLVDHPSGQHLTRLTTHAYNEHAQFTPDGTHIAWMSSAGNPRRGTDYWMSRTDGTGLARLSRLGKWLIAADLSFAPDGRSFVGYVIDHVGSSDGRVILFEGL